LSDKANYQDLQSRVRVLEKEVGFCRQIQEAVFAERQQLLAIFEELPALVFLETSSHIISYGNDCFRDRFGEPGERSCAEIFRRTITHCPVPNILQEMQPRTWDWFEAPDGPIRVYAYPFATREPGDQVILQIGMEVSGQPQLVFENQLLREELRHAMVKLRHFQNLVPICSCCRSFRNDNELRQDLVSYVHNHTDETFTFGLCPSCREKLLLLENDCS
jgi:PAS domain-containing protein